MLILSLKGSSDLTKIENIWNELSYKDISVETISNLYSELSAVKPSHNAMEVNVEYKSKLYIKTYSSIKQCAKDLKISPKTIAKYLNTGLIYNDLIKKKTQTNCTI